MNLFRWYKYIYYKLYKQFEDGPLKRRESKASVSIDALCIWTFISIVAYYMTATKTKVELSIGMPVIWIPTVGIVLFNHFIFNYKGKWKGIVREFDKWDRKKNRIGGWIALGIVLITIANMVFAFYLMSTVDWTKY